MRCIYLESVKFAEINLPKLTDLCLRAWRYDWDALTLFVGRCANLEKLDISQADHINSEQTIHLLRSCPHLRALDVRYSNVGDVAFEFIAQHCTDLEVLYLGWRRL